MPLRDSKTLKNADQNFPALLKEIPDVPQQIYVIGDLPEDSIMRVAVVGTRKATVAGRVLARSVAKALALRGVVVVSGLAMGIDTASHEGCLDAQAKTIAVLANGLDAVYPAQNEYLAKKILEYGGAIISEYPPGTPSFPNQFLERNRIISGLSTAVIIVEAPDKSGSLATARFAAEQGRDVLVFPGPHNHPNYQGSHQLLRDGARLVGSIEDVLEDLGLSSGATTAASRQANNLSLEDLTSDQALVVEVIKNSAMPIPIDKIIELTKLDPQAVNQCLTLLSFRNFIKETEKGYTI